MDKLTFNMIPSGRQFAVGTSNGGSPIRLSVPGKVVKSIKIGFGGDIHFIGV